MNKGATSGHTQKVHSITYDCDGDALLVKVEQKGAACHTGTIPVSSIPCGTVAPEKACRWRTTGCPR